VGVVICAPRLKKCLSGLGKEYLGERYHRLRLSRIDLPLELAAYGVDPRKLFTDAESHRAGGVAPGYAGLSLFALGPRSAEEWGLFRRAPER